MAIVLDIGVVDISFVDIGIVVDIAHIVGARIRTTIVVAIIIISIVLRFFDATQNTFSQLSRTGGEERRYVSVKCIEAEIE